MSQIVTVPRQIFQAARKARKASKIKLVSTFSNSQSYKLLPLLILVFPFPSPSILISFPLLVTSPSHHFTSLHPSPFSSFITFSNGPKNSPQKRFGIEGSTNVQGEEVKKLDVLANELFINMIKSSYAAAMLISEENEDVIEIDPDKQG